MKYMLLVYLDEERMSEAEREHCYVESAQLAQDLSASGKYHCCRSAASGCDRHERARAKRQAAGD